MRVAGDRLAQCLKDKLPPAILLFGEEPLLIEESLAAIRQTALARGFTERIPLSAEPKFDWSRLTSASQNRSLFSERCLIEVRLPGGKPGDDGTRAFAECCAVASGEFVLVVITGRLDGRSKQAKWVKTLDAVGWVVEHRALSPAQFTGWFRGRLGTRGLKLDNEAIERLCYFLEGNLLAAAQEIDRLALFADAEGRVTSDVVDEGLADHARFTVYAVADSCLKGDARKALRVLGALRSEGVQPVLVSWALSRDVRILLRIEHGLRSGGRKDALFRANGIWASKAPLVGAALARLGDGELERLTAQMARCDRVLKGRVDGNIWRELDVLALMMCDIRYPVEQALLSDAAP